MVTTCQQGLRVLAACCLALALGGCTYDENELRPWPYTPSDAAADTSTGGVDAPAIVPLDAEALDVGTVLDGGVDAPLDAPMLDSAIDSGGPGALDTGAVDLPALDGPAADASDVPITSVTIDGAIDVSPLDGGVTEAGGVDGDGGQG
jgi:hypothetical protein